MLLSMAINHIVLELRMLHFVFRGVGDSAASTAPTAAVGEGAEHSGLGQRLAEFCGSAALLVPGDYCKFTGGGKSDRNSFFFIFQNLFLCNRVFVAVYEYLGDRL